MIQTERELGATPCTIDNYLLYELRVIPSIIYTLASTSIKANRSHSGGAR
jgi:hypothetical protein